MTEFDPRHVLAAECGVEADPVDYVDGAVNALGELMIFHQRPRERMATFYHSDLDWEPIPVDERSIGIDRSFIEIFVVNGYIFEKEEISWLARCLLATDSMRRRR